MGPAGDRSPLHRDLRSKSQRAPGLEADSGLPWCGEPGREGVAGGLQEEAFRRQRTASGQLEPGEGVRCHSVHVMSSYLWPREHPACRPGAAQALFTAEIGLHFPLWRLPSWIPSRRSLLSFVLTQSRPLVSRLRNS